MAGGIFDERPFVLNIKCVIISIIGIILFMIPGYSLYEGYALFIVLSLLFIILYVAIAYYDHLYDCEPKWFKDIIQLLDL